MATVQVRDIHKSYGDLKAIDGLEFEIVAGESFGLLGPNGAGKTTMIAMVTGLLQPDRGEVLIDGESPQNASVRHKIGLAPQSLALYDELTARENLQFFAQLYSLSGKRLAEQIAWALDFSGLTDRATDRVGTFSGGMKRRLNLACALIHEPSIILMDEPTVGVDPQSRNHLFDCIQHLQQQGLTIVYTTHYMEEAERLCDRIAIVDHGQLLALDTVGNLLRDYGGDSLVLAEFKKPVPQGVQLPGEIKDTKWRVESRDPMNDVSMATRQGLDFHSLNISRPDLESVFLKLTGRRLRD